MARLLRIGGDDPIAARDVRRAVVLVSSVKTLPVAVTVLGKLSPLLGEAAVGLAVVPCVFAHLGQIVWDSLMVSKWKAADESQQALDAIQAEGRQQTPNTAKDA
jgi:sodium/bile acid cotransporter 7